MRYLLDNFPHVWELTKTHLFLALVPLVLGLIIAVPLGTAVRNVSWLRRGTLTTASILYTIPSLALFVIIPPLFSLPILSKWVVIIALTIYSTALLVRTVPEALDSVPADVVDASNAVGFPLWRRAITVDLPLSLPVLIAGLRVVAVTNISLVPIGSLIGVHGLGELFTDGYNRNYLSEIYAGIIGVVVLALLFDALLFLLGRFLTPWTRLGKQRETKVKGAAA